jgi:GT2 family glycosyltransferase
MIDLDIVIVNWNNGSELYKCLQSILAACPPNVIHLCQCVVVDNASTDGSLTGLAGLSLPLEIVQNSVNKGFAYASNQGAKVGVAKYILFLNPDSRLFPDNLQKALYFLEEKQNQSIGILGIQLVDGAGNVQRNVARFPTPSSFFYQMLGFDRLFPKYFPAHFMREWNHQESMEVNQVTGAFYLVRRQVFEKLDGFDERFFMYFEDLDFAYRARQAGWKSYYLAETKALHYGGGSSNQVKARRLFYILNSRVLYVAKHFGLVAAFGIMFASVGVESWIRLGRDIKNLSWYNFNNTFHAYAMFLIESRNLIRGLLKTS